MKRFSFHRVRSSEANTIYQWQKWQKKNLPLTLRMDDYLECWCQKLLEYVLRCLRTLKKQNTRCIEKKKAKVSSLATHFVIITTQKMKK